MLYAHLFTPLVSQAPRGLSAEEKRIKLLEIFHETVGFLVIFSERLTPVIDKPTLSAEGLLSGGEGVFFLLPH